MKTIHITDEEADAVDCAMGIVLGMAEGAKIVSLRAAMESAREKVNGPQIYEVIEAHYDPENGEERIHKSYRQFEQTERDE